MDVIMRVAGPLDEQEVVALWRACGLTTEYNDPVADFRLAVIGPASTVLVAVEATGQIAGTVMVGHDGHRGWLYYVASHPSRRNEGIGRIVVEAGERWLLDQRITKVQLLVREANAAVAAFYAKLGFEETPRILMAKWLTPSTDDRAAEPDLRSR